MVCNMRQAQICCVEQGVYSTKLQQLSPFIADVFVKVRGNVQPNCLNLLLHDL